MQTQGEAQAKVDDTIVSLTEKVLRHYKHEGEYEITMCFSDNENSQKENPTDLQN